MKRNKFFRITRDYLLITLGAAVAAAGINIFLFPYKIASGGITGLATILYYVIDGLIPLGLLVAILNVPLFIAGVLKLGWRFISGTLYATLAMSIIIDVTEPVFVNLAGKWLSDGVSDMMLFSIFGGLLLGAGMGIIFRMNATTGGTDLIAEIVIRSGLNLSMGQTIFIFDAAIVITAGIVFKSLPLALYAIIAILVISKTVDYILDGLSPSKGLFIISGHHEEISARILTELDRGLTGFKGVGKYTGEEKEILFCVAIAKYIPEIKRIVKECDPKAFVVVTNVHEVLGEGFRGFDNKIG